MKEYETSTEPGKQTEMPVPQMSKQDIMDKILKLKLEHPYHPSIPGLQGLLDNL
jgi:hypothetical protein